MRIINAFFLALFVYSAILFFFLYFILNRPKPKPPIVVYVHQAIAFKEKKEISKKPKIEQKIIKPQKPKVEKKAVEKTKDNFSKGGEDIKFDDIFSNVSENVKTTKIKQKKQKNMTREVGDSIVKEVKKQLQNLQTTSAISNVTGSNSDAEFVQNEFSKVWGQINTNPGDFIKININIQNGVVNVIVIATNLDTIRLNQFLTKIKSIDTTKINNFKAVIDFKSKLKDEK